MYNTIFTLKRNFFHVLSREESADGFVDNNFTAASVVSRIFFPFWLKNYIFSVLAVILEFPISLLDKFCKRLRYILSALILGFAYKWLYSNVKYINSATVYVTSKFVWV